MLVDLPSKSHSIETKKKQNQREREAREARQLDREIRHQQERYHHEAKKHKEAAVAAAVAAELQKQATHVSTQLSQLQKLISTGTPLATPRSPRDSLDKTDSKIIRSHHDKYEALASTAASSSSAVRSIARFKMNLTNDQIGFDFFSISFNRIQKVKHRLVKPYHWLH